MQGYLQLLLPVATASGGLAAQRSAQLGAKGSEETCVGEAGQFCFCGFNDLLDEQLDKTSDALFELLEVDRYSVGSPLASMRARPVAVTIDDGTFAGPSIRRRLRSEYDPRNAMKATKG